MNTDPKDEQTRDNGRQSTISPNEEKELEENDVQRGLTGEGDDDEDVAGDIAGNAAGNPED